MEPHLNTPMCHCSSGGAPQPCRRHVQSAGPAAAALDTHSSPAFRVQECPALAATLAATIRSAPATFGALAAHHAITAASQPAAAQQPSAATQQQPLKSDSAQDMAYDTHALPSQAGVSKANLVGASNGSSGGSGGGSKAQAASAAGLQRDDSASALDLIAALHLGDKPHSEGFRRKHLPSSGQLQSAIRE
jgi:pimeloyl-ACP methyl ester carboxylesterase